MKLMLGLKNETQRKVKLFGASKMKMLVLR